MLENLFTLDRRLGIGATAEVYLGFRRDDHTPRALKIFTPIVLSDEETVRRIQVEVETLQALSHPNIVRLYQSHGDQDELALELEFVDGSDLRRWAEKYKTHLAEPKLWILCQVARGLACAHENGILHRDLKPENILISKSGDVKLTDFGLARQLDSVTMTKSGLLSGSIGYMAPEILDGQRPTAQADLFSFGAVAYELLAGKNPFWGSNPQAALKCLVNGKFRPLAEVTAGVPPTVLAIIEQCLALDPSSRPRSIWHVEAELMHALGYSPMHKLARALVSHEHDHYLTPAFTEKRKELAARREQLPATDSAPWLLLLRDWNYAFPNDPEAAALLAGVPAAPVNPWRRRALPALAALLLLFIGTGWWLWPREPATVATTTPPSPLVTDSISVPAAAPVPAAATQAPVALTARPSVEHGWIRVEADPDVEIFVDGKFIPQSRWGRITVKPGTRALRMVKQGFLPIENKIEVRANQTAVVKAKGGGA